MFLALYQWHVKPGKEAQFRAAWRRGTMAITKRYGSFGSRLCKADDGRFIGVAEWPDEATWREAMAHKMVYDDKETRALFLEAIQDGGAPIFAMPVVEDLLIRPPS